MVTLRKISEESGFSIPVVSRALSPKQHKGTRMAAATQTRIQEVARRLGYRPNRMAEFLKRGQSPVIGCFLPARADSLLAKLMKGISIEANLNHFPITFYFDTSKNSYAEFLEASRQSKNCGIITYPYFKSDPESDELLARYWSENGKIVLLEAGSRNWKWGEAVSVSADDYAGGRIAAERLLAQGVNNFFTLRYTHIPERVDGFVNTLDGASKQVVMFNDIEHTLLLDAVENFTTRHSGKTAGIFVPQDPIGISLLCEALSRGMDVGGNVRLVSFDGLYSSGLTTPGLTVVAQPFERIGALAVRKLISLIYNKKAESELIEPELIIRETG